MLKKFEVLCLAEVLEVLTFFCSPVVVRLLLNGLHKRSLSQKMTLVRARQTLQPYQVYRVRVVDALFADAMLT